MIYESDRAQIHNYICCKHNIQQFSNLGYVPEYQYGLNGINPNDNTENVGILLLWDAHQTIWYFDY